MPKTKRPRRGSMAFYPKKRSKRIYPNVKTWVNTKETKPLGFAGYKAGMTHVVFTDNNPNSTTHGQEISAPVTILDCPPLSVFGFRCYTGNKTSFDVFSEKLDKNLSRKIKVPKKTKGVEEQMKKMPEKITKIMLLCHTNPNFKKKPEIFEIPVGGVQEEQVNYAKGMLGKQIKVSDVFRGGDNIDVVAISKGKGFQGEVKRFGVKVLGRKAQKMQRHTGSHGQNEPGKVRFTVPQPGQLGFQRRTEINKLIFKIDTGFQLDGGILGYGNIDGDYALVKGSVPGPKKRLVVLRFATRNKKTYPIDIKYISTESKQSA